MELGPLPTRSREVLEARLVTRHAGEAAERAVVRSLEPRHVLPGEAVLAEAVAARAVPGGRLPLPAGRPVRFKVVPGLPAPPVIGIDVLNSGPPLKLAVRAGAVLHRVWLSPGRHGPVLRGFRKRLTSFTIATDNSATSLGHLGTLPLWR